MATSILLKAKAKSLGIPNYRQMDAATLEAAVKTAEGKSAPAKGSAVKGSAAKGSGTKGSGKGSAKTSAAKGSAKKGSAKSSPAKSTQPATKAASKKGTAKRTTAKKATASKSKGSAKRTPAKKTTTAKPKASRKNVPARVDIDRTQIDWKAESNVGRTGKRAEVMEALRKRKGNYDKVYDDLQHRAKSYYPGKPIAEARKTLRWLINRVAFDFVMSTEQHTPGERAAYGTSDAANNVRRRELRAEARPKTKAPAKKKAAKGSKRK